MAASSEKLNSEHKLLGNGCVFKRALAVWVVVAYGLAVAGGFGNAHGTRDRYLEELVGVIFFQLSNHLTCEGESAVVHCE